MNTTKTVQHSPAPWHLIGSRDSGFTIHASLPDDAGDTDVLAVCRNISRDTNEANAAHIVLCVNSHDALVKALGTIATWLIAPDLSKSTLEEMRQTANAALAAAQSKP